MLQACALIHDDVMDGSELRRGRPSTHIEFANYHNTHCATGSAATFGQGAAILLGDLALAWADELLESVDIDATTKMGAKSLYNTMRSELMAGQYLDLLIQQSTSPTIEQITNVMRFKSAKYTIERPLHLGAILAGAAEETLSALSEYGLALGEAFQLRDDLLGIFGESEVTGKPVGDDLREGKQTLLIAYARAVLNEPAFAELNQMLGSSELSTDQIAKAQDILHKAGAVDRAEEQIAGLLKDALSALQSPAVSETARAALTKLAIAATQRKV
jgi:geranylgeranyl diphosphate synthase type I